MRYELTGWLPKSDNIGDSKKESREKFYKFFYGTVCSVCGEDVRYTSSNQCLNCSQNRYKNNYVTESKEEDQSKKAQEALFKAMGRPDDGCARWSSQYEI